MLRPVSSVAGSSVLALVWLLAATGSAPLSAAPPTTPSDGPPAHSQSALAPPAMLATAVTEQRLVAQAIEQEVDAALRHAAAAMASDPAAATLELKTALGLVISSGDLDAATRKAVRSRLETALRTAARRSAEQQASAVERQTSAAAAAERQRVLAAMDNRQEKLKQLCDRFESLMSESRYELAQQVAEEIESESDPAPANQPRLNAGLTKATREALVTRVRRQQGVVDTLASVETSFVAQPDDEPIVYMPAAAWQELTRSRARYAHTDMHRQTAAEARLSKALAETTEFDFVETPLRDVLDYFKDLHGIEIQLDTRSLEQEGLDSEVLVTRRIRGISLRSALRLLLGSLDLTYTMQDEVLLVTTPERAGRQLQTKVYPVEQLVLPVRPPSFTGGFGRLGGFGSSGGNSMMGGGGQNGGGGINNLFNNQPGGGGNGMNMQGMF